MAPFSLLLCFLTFFSLCAGYASAAAAAAAAPLDGKHSFLFAYFCAHFLCLFILQSLNIGSSYHLTFCGFQISNAKQNVALAKCFQILN